MTSQRERLKVLSAGIFSLLLTFGVARFAYTPLLPLMQQQAGLGLAEAGWLAALNYAGYLCGALVASLIGEVPVAPSYSGTYVCLPHKDQSGPQTLECAFGIHLDDGSHYGLDFSAFSSAQGMTVATGERIRIEGTLVSGDQWNIYDIRGVIRVANITRL